MAEHNDFGAWGEEVAAQYLQQQGYQVLIQNYRSYEAEVDIIARLNQTLIIVEVKTRKDNYFGDPAEHVSEKKQTLLAEAAWAYAESIDWEGPIRFDIISIIGTPAVSASIQHLEDAFFPHDDADDSLDGTSF